MLTESLNWGARRLIRLALLFLVIPHAFGGNGTEQMKSATDAPETGRFRARSSKRLSRFVDRLKVLFHPGPLLRFAALRYIGKIQLPEYRFKWPQMAWWANPDFNDYLQRFKEIEGMNTDRRWMLGQLMRLTRNVQGDTAECGAFEGAGSYLICKSNSANPDRRRLQHVFDSFEGLSSPAVVDGTHWKKGDLSRSAEAVRENLSEFSTSVVLHKGWIPERFGDIADQRFAFVHIDVDLYQPTLDSVSFFYPRMSEGGVILCDDYGFTSCPGATQAIDEYLADKKEKMISLSCGGGFLIKGCTTAPHFGDQPSQR